MNTKVKHPWWMELKYLLGLKIRPSKPIQKVVEDALYEAELDLLDAQEALEDQQERLQTAVAKVALLSQRVERLFSQAGLDDPDDDLLPAEATVAEDEARKTSPLGPWPSSAASLKEMNDLSRRVGRLPRLVP